MRNVSKQMDLWKFLGGEKTLVLPLLFTAAKLQHQERQAAQPLYSPAFVKHS